MLIKIKSIFFNKSSSIHENISVNVLFFNFKTQGRNDQELLNSNFLL